MLDQLNSTLTLNGVEYTLAAPAWMDATEEFDIEEFPALSDIIEPDGELGPLVNGVFQTEAREYDVFGSLDTITSQALCLVGLRLETDEGFMFISRAELERQGLGAQVEQIENFQTEKRGDA